MTVLKHLFKQPKHTIFRTFSSSSYSTTPPPQSIKRNVQWVFLGCPGVGKGTYASRLSKLIGVPHIATGDLVRDELSSKGPLSQQVLYSIINPNSLLSLLFCIKLGSIFKNTFQGEMCGYLFKMRLKALN